MYVCVLSTWTLISFHPIGEKTNATPKPKHQTQTLRLLLDVALSAAGPALLLAATAHAASGPAAAVVDGSDTEDTEGSGAAHAAPPAGAATGATLIQMGPAAAAAASADPFHVASTTAFDARAGSVGADVDAGGRAKGKNGLGKYLQALRLVDAEVSCACVCAVYMIIRMHTLNINIYLHIMI